VACRDTALSCRYTSFLAIYIWNFDAMSEGKRILRASDIIHEDTVTIMGKRHIVYRVVPPKHIIKKTEADRCNINISNAYVL
jgi:hypothetical protein